MKNKYGYKRAGFSVYIRKVKLNGEAYAKSYIHYADIVAGGKLEFFMTDKPSDVFGTAKESRP